MCGSETPAHRAVATTTNIDITPKRKPSLSGLREQLQRTQAGVSSKCVTQRKQQRHMCTKAHVYQGTSTCGGQPWALGQPPCCGGRDRWDGRGGAMGSRRQSQDVGGVGGWRWRRSSQAAAIWPRAAMRSHASGIALWQATKLCHRGCSRLPLIRHRHALRLRSARRGHLPRGVGVR